jgi:hypothetical protein
MMESEERASPPSVSTLLAIGEMALFIEVGTLVPSNPNKYIVPWRDRSLDTNIVKENGEYLGKSACPEDLVDHVCRISWH